MWTMQCDRHQLGQTGPARLHAAAAAGLFGVVFAVLFSAGCDGGTPTTEADVLAVLQQPRTAVELENLAKEGRIEFVKNTCTTCHVVEGAARGAPRLRNLYTTQAQLLDGTKINRDRSYIIRSILHPRENIVAGYPQVMMSSFNYLEAEQIAALVTYLEQYSPKPGNRDVRAGSAVERESRSEVAALPIPQE